MDNTLVCARCGVGLKEKEISFSYLDHRFTHTLPACPSCGQVFLSEELVNGRVADLEKVFEEK